MPFPQRPRVPVAVADVQRPADVGAPGHRVDRLHGQPDVLGIARQERFVDLKHACSGPGEFRCLGGEHQGERPHQAGVVGVRAARGVADPVGQRVRPGDGQLHRPVGELPDEPEVLGQAEVHAARRGQRVADAGVVVVEVIGLVRPRDLHAGDPGEQVVDVVVAAQLPVGDDVDAGPLLVIDRCLDRHLVDLVEVPPADPVPVAVVLQLAEPLGNRVRADHGGRQQDRVAVGHSRTPAVSVLTFDDGRAANGEMRTSKPARPPMCRSSGPLTQFTTDPSYLPGPKNPEW